MKQKHPLPFPLHSPYPAYLSTFLIKCAASSAPFCPVGGGISISYCLHGISKGPALLTLFQGSLLPGPLHSLSNTSTRWFVEAAQTTLQSLQEWSALKQREKAQVDSAQKKHRDIVCRTGLCASLCGIHLRLVTWLQSRPLLQRLQGSLCSSHKPPNLCDEKLHSVTECFRMSLSCASRLSNTDKLGQTACCWFMSHVSAEHLATAQPITHQTHISITTAANASVNLRSCLPKQDHCGPLGLHSSQYASLQLGQNTVLAQAKDKSKQRAVR